MMDWRNWAIGILSASAAYFLTREFSRKDAVEAVVGKLAEAVVALQGAVRALEKFNESHDRDMVEVRRERAECEARCPYRGGGK